MNSEILFRAPDALNCENKRGVFVHHGRLAGELSHYGESVRLVADLALNDSYTTELYRKISFETSGPYN